MPQDDPFRQLNDRLSRLEADAATRDARKAEVRKKITDTLAPLPQDEPVPDEIIFDLLLAILSI